jgi:hypothetical protein
MFSGFKVPIGWIMEVASQESDGGGDWLSHRLKLCMNVGLEVWNIQTQYSIGRVGS